jgi:hypothetical protein
MPSNITALSLLAHPLLARLNLGEDGRPVRWECHAKVQEPEGFTLATRPPLPVAQPAADLDWQNMAHESRVMVLCALEANRVTPLSGFCALVDTRDRTVHHVDFLAERDGRPCLVLVYYTQQRARASRDLDAIARQCQCLRRLCQEQYAMPGAHVCVVNVHFIASPIVGDTTRIVGAWVIPPNLRHLRAPFPPPPPPSGTASAPPAAGPPPGSPPRTAP